MPNDAQRAVITKYGLAVAGAALLLILPLIPAALDVIVGVAGMGFAWRGGMAYQEASR